MGLRYVVGYDGSPASRAAVGLTVVLAEAEGAETIVAHVHAGVAPLYAQVGVDVGPELFQELRRHGEEVLAGLDVEGVGERVLLDGSPARALHDLAEERGASLLAVGLTHREGLERLVAGSVPASLLHGSPCPVLTVPADARIARPRVIAVAYDGGPESRRALDAAARLAAALGAQLVLLGAIDPASLAPNALGAGVDVGAEVHAAFRRLLAEGAASVSGVPVRTEALVGDAGREIVEATREGVDLLLTGSRAYGPLRSVVLGSMSRFVVDHAACPVLVIPRTAEAEVDREPPPSGDE